MPHVHDRERRARRLPTRRLVLTYRDGRLLLALHEYRHLTLGQVERLFFPSTQTAARRVRILERAGFLSTFAAPGMESRFVTLAREGASLVSYAVGTPVLPAFGGKGRPEPRDYLFLRHFQTVTDLRIALKVECEREGIRLLDFIPEYVACRSTHGHPVKHIRDVVPAGRPGETITHTPDGVFALERDGACALFFLEADRGTEVIGDERRGVLRMVYFYLSLLTCGGFQRYQEKFGCVDPFRGFRALLVTTSAARLRNIREAGGKVLFEPVQAKRFIWLSTVEQTRVDGILGPVWRSLDPDDPAEYAIAGGEAGGNGTGA